MTYQQFLNGNYLRPIKGFPDYGITNKGRIYSYKTKRFLKKYENGTIFLSESGEQVRLNSHKLLLETYPDVEFTTREIRRYTKIKNMRQRGAYKYPHGRKNWRSVISVDSTKITLGYYRTKKEALRKFHESYLIFRGYRPW